MVPPGPKGICVMARPVAAVPVIPRSANTPANNPGCLRHRESSYVAAIFSRRDGDGIHCDFPVGHRQRADGYRRARGLVRVLRIVEEGCVGFVAGLPSYRAVLLRHDVEAQEHDVFEAETSGLQTLAKRFERGNRLRLEI